MKRLLVLAILIAVPCSAQQATLPLWPNGVPGPRASAEPEALLPISSDINVPRLSNDSEPRIEVFLPSEDVATGAPVVVAPSLDESPSSKLDAFPDVQAGSRGPLRRHLLDR